MQRPFTSLALLLIACLLSPGSSRAETKPASRAVPFTPPKSTFVDNVGAGSGRDPFFPNSSRTPKVVVKTTDPEPPRPTVPDSITLKGISIVKDNKLAIINNYTLAEGEEFSLRAGGQVIKVKLVEIKVKSVIVSVNGATKEIALRAGF